MATNPVWVTLITASLGGLLAGLLTLVGVMITQRHARRREDAQWHRECERDQTRWAREDAARSDERTQQRLADSYLEVLRIVEREGQWIEASITYRSRIAADEFMAYERVMVPAPAVTDRGTIGAHLAAFGSNNVRKLHQSWRSTITKIENEDAKLELIAEDQELGADHLRHLLEELHPHELGARLALADAIAAELGHR